MAAAVRRIVRGSGKKGEALADPAELLGRKICRVKLDQGLIEYLPGGRGVSGTQVALGGGPGIERNAPGGVGCGGVGLGGGRGIPETAKKDLALGGEKEGLVRVMPECSIEPGESLPASGFPGGIASAVPPGKIIGDDPGTIDAEAEPLRVQPGGEIEVCPGSAVVLPGPVVGAADPDEIRDRHPKAPGEPGDYGLPGRRRPFAKVGPPGP